MRDLMVTALSSAIFHVQLRRNRRQRESMMTRYGILKTDLGLDVSGVQTPVLQADGLLVFQTDAYALRIDLSASMSEVFAEEGFHLDVQLAPSDRLFGLGDENRDTLMKRGRVCDLWQTNVVCYGPVPYVMSSAGWGILINSTYRQRYDLGKTDHNQMCVDCRKGMLDFFVFLGKDMAQTLDLYTQVSGRPLLLPKAAYGLTFVCNEEEGARDLLENCLAFRREKIPCDIIGLEPGWMSKHYDFSLDKKWDEGRFYLPYWHRTIQGLPRSSITCASLVFCSVYGCAVITICSGRRTEARARTIRSRWKRQPLRTPIFRPVC
ncbi:MAG: glycoside hydrolase family 31 protein [Clostridia bacterium]